jgi:uncharacterized protein
MNNTAETTIKNEIGSVTTHESNEMSIGKSILLHILPGMLIVIFDIVFAPIVVAMNYPLIFTLVLGDLIILIPFELGVLLYQSKKENGNYKIGLLHPNHEKLKPLKFVIYLVVLFVYGFLINTIFSKITGFFEENAFGWMPDVFHSGSNAYVLTVDFSEYSQTAKIVTMILSLVVIGILVPIVEELYFRGFLMSRLSKFKIWSPVISVGLWAVYHLWSPWAILQYFVIFILIGFVVYRTKNLKLSIISHALANMMLVISMYPVFFP